MKPPKEKKLSSVMRQLLNGGGIPTPEDPKTLNVGVNNGHVVIQLPIPATFMTFTPEQAEALAASLIENAKAARTPAVTEATSADAAH